MTTRNRCSTWLIYFHRHSTTQSRTFAEVRSSELCRVKRLRPTSLRSPSRWTLCCNQWSKNVFPLNQIQMCKRQCPRPSRPRARSKLWERPQRSAWMSSRASSISNLRASPWRNKQQFSWTWLRRNMSLIIWPKLTKAKISTQMRRVSLRARRISPRSRRLMLLHFRSRWLRSILGRQQKILTNL